MLHCTESFFHRVHHMTLLDNQIATVLVLVVAKHGQHFLSSEWWKLTVCVFLMLWIECCSHHFIIIHLSNVKCLFNDVLFNELL